ncbi:hypothetical protein E3N88_22331 [Mikania micrantha]|uniref:COI1 F-box domain-containing protein n=1 Tax=Mikania micrantha TaxID=192012 RepID=A0A5N6NBY7_9ASTR|nr:hypothetical protein E3N88_22331 [Mikania micrantha]
MSEDDGGGGRCRNSATGASTGAGEYYTAYPDQVLENVLENVLVFLKSRRDRSAVSLVCKSWVPCGGVHQIGSVHRELLRGGSTAGDAPVSRGSELVLVCCDGFGTSGLAVIASECRNLRVLELIEDEVSDDEIDWISCFPFEGFREIAPQYLPSILPLCANLISLNLSFANIDTESS